MGQKAGVLQGPKAGGVPATWSDSNINISLDLLSPQSVKPQQPTLNMMQQGTHTHTHTHILTLMQDREIL